MSDASAPVIQAWIAPEISGPVVRSRYTRHSREELDQVGKDAWDAGYAKGLEAGAVAAQNANKPHLAALQLQVLRLQGVFELLSAPLAELDETVAEELAKLACTIARHVVRRELRSDPSQVIAAVREAVALLPVSARDVRVHLHPDDAAILRAKLAEPQANRAWTIVEDPVLERGGCRVTSENSQIDARLDSRLGAVVAAVLGDGRAAGAERPAGEAS